MPHAPADFRSDTVTRPTPEMRRAMAEAVVGDDVYGEDPTVSILQQETAALFGRNAALFVPTGCMGNQIAVRLHTRPGEEVAVEALSHTFDWELAAMAALSGVQARALPSDRGSMDPDVVRGAVHPAGGFRPRCGLLIVENTHNFHGGAIVPIARIEALHAITREKGAALHIDGARIWNAAVATGTPLRAYGAAADSLMVALSKGLGAPVGSMLVGDAEWIARAREARKLLGGGMRQVGVLAAAGLIAIRSMRDRLADDHRRARRLADGLLRAAGTSLPCGPVDTNIVILRIASRDAKELVRKLKERGVLVGDAGTDRLRFVTHLDIDDEDIEKAVDAFTTAVA